jgi:hypothetical protein
MPTRAHIQGDCEEEEEREFAIGLEGRFKTNLEDGVLKKIVKRVTLFHHIFV